MEILWKISLVVGDETSNLSMGREVSESTERD